MAKISDSEDMEPRILAKQWGCLITQIDPNVVIKRGSRVRPNEEAAIRLVREYAPSVPVPQVYHSLFRIVNGINVGQLFMSFVPGETLENVWDTLGDIAKERVCCDIWSLISKIRTIPRPAHLATNFHCTADGSPSLDPLLGDRNDVTPPLPSDEALRTHIFARYVKSYGLTYADGKDLPNMLPRSNKYVFTHGDIAPRNIMVDKGGQILGLLDWESAGWYPDYWEYANIMKPSADGDWMAWMDRTKPTAWDITGITKARRVLF